LLQAQNFYISPPFEAFSTVCSYVDLQSTLHVVTRKARTRSGFHMLLHRRLDELLDKYSPTQRVVFAMDGPAPLAKLLEQRRRRRRESDRTVLAELAGETGEAGEVGKLNKSLAISPLFLTTGTLFMLEVHNSLVYYICRKLSDPRHRNISFELSDSTVKGEGELKILSRLLHSTTTDRPQEGEKRSESHVILGGDSDLLLMVMIAGQQNVTVCDDAPERRGHLQKQVQKPRLAAFRRDALEATWKKEALGPDATRAQVTNFALELTLLAILCSGNDYLPACQGVQLQNKLRPGLWNLYLDMRRQPEWRGRSLVSRTCDGCESQSISDGLAENSGLPFCPGGTKVVIDYDMLMVLLSRYQLQRFFEGGGEGEAATLIGDTPDGAWNFGCKDIPADTVALNNGARFPQTLDQPWRHPADPRSYFQGLEWVLTMYATGRVEDYRFSYQGASLTLPAIIQYITEKSTSSNAGQDTDTKRDKDRPATTLSRNGKVNQPLIPAACALALLPARNRRQAATALRHLMDADSPVAEIYAVCKECQQLALRLRSVSGELENVRRELATLQSKLAGAAALDSQAPHEAEEDLMLATARCEAAQEKLRDLLGDLSRSQQEHLREKHPYKPFPTEELEAAVYAVPPEKYPPRERRLARFGREMLFRYNKEHGTVIEETPTVMPAWLRDASRFVAAYPRLGNSTIVHGASHRVVRELLPLYPYMNHRGSKGGPLGVGPNALGMVCQLRRYGQYGGQCSRGMATFANCMARVLPHLRFCL
jgi:hypothetical protein